MATCATGTLQRDSPASSSTTAKFKFLGNSWNGATGIVGLQTQWGIGSFTSTDNDGTSVNPSGSWTTGFKTGLTADANYIARARIFDDSGEADGTTKAHLSSAMVAAASVPTSSAVTANTATIACNYIPRTNVSTCSAQLQYKKTVDVSWTNAGTAQSGGGYGTLNVSRNITGLDASTEYQVRLVLTRTTANDTTTTSATHSFTTLAGIPIVTTNTPTAITATSATLNGTLDINAGTNVNVYFKWGTDNPPTQNQTANQPMSADGDFSQGISGLSQNLYHFQAFASFDTPTGSPVSGSVLSFIFAKAGSLWIDGTKLHVIASTFQDYAAEGTLIGAAAGQLGSIWVEGDNLNYIDAAGNERSISGSDEGIQTGKAGSIWQEGTYLGWLDASQHKRLGTGVLQ